MTMLLVLIDCHCSSRFEYGVGTQVMLASTVFSPVTEQLLDSARKLLNEDEVAALKRKLSDVC